MCTPSNEVTKASLKSSQKACDWFEYNIDAIFKNVCRYRDLVLLSVTWEKNDSTDTLFDGMGKQFCIEYRPEI